jgi:hypothetical protein
MNCAIRSLALALFAIAMVPVWVIVTVSLLATMAVEWFVVGFIFGKETA